MISTVSFSFDLTAAVPRCVIVDSTTYPFPLDFYDAKGYGVLTFNGEIIEEKNTPSEPLIDLVAGQTTAYINLPLDINGNVANGVYSFQYSLRLDSGAGGAGPVGTVSGNFTFTTAADWLSEVVTVGSSVGIDGVNNTISAVSFVGGNSIITLGSFAANGSGQVLTFNNNISPQFSGIYSYSGCTQTTADVDFVYDCEYGDSGTWSVSNATVLGSNEIVTSLSCTINYPSWTTADPVFNPQVVTTVLPYPTFPSPTPPVTTPLATGTYSVSLAEQIQQTQASGLVVIYNKSVIKEFAVSCAGSLCGLVPCIENLRAAHAAELVRNRISKYQVFVDNVALYYIEAMNYRSCGDLDKYKATIDLLQAQLDASGCDCACCDDNSYYWVSNNSANSIIEELLANFQYRLFDGGIVDPGPIQPGVQYGAIWQNTNTGVLYRCIDATAGDLEWILFYDPSLTYVTGADNGLSISGDNVVLGGSLDAATTIDLNSQDLTFSNGTVTASALSNALQVNGGVGALTVTGTTNALDVSVNNSVAGRFTVDRTTNDNVATVLSLRATVDGGSGDDGIGTSIQFASQSSTNLSTTASIESVLVSATSPIQANLNFKTRSNSGTTLLDRFTLNPDYSATLHSYGATGASTPSSTLILNGSATSPINGYGTSIDFVANDASSTYTGNMSRIISTWQNAISLDSRLDITTIDNGVESTQLGVLANGDLYLNKYGDGTKVNAAQYHLGVASNGQVVESEMPVYSLIVLRVTQSNSDVTIQQIINTTKDPVAGANNSGAGDFRLAHPSITAAKTSVLVQNGNIGPSSRIGFVYAEVGSGLINFKTYGATSGTLLDAVLNNAIVEIKIFP